MRWSGLKRRSERGSRTYLLPSPRSWCWLVQTPARARCGEFAACGEITAIMMIDTIGPMPGTVIRRDTLDPSRPKVASAAAAICRGKPLSASAGNFVSRPPARATAPATGKAQGNAGDQLNRFVLFEKTPTPPKAASARVNKSDDAGSGTVETETGLQMTASVTPFASEL
jgi:hypothetical protein